ncbi:hypothetical protein E4U53_008056 [Claviceps sorghi]|nr:hypothetical protein E4U53_008056 [Claviceps sorghi]
MKRPARSPLCFARQWCRCRCRRPALPPRRFSSSCSSSTPFPDLQSRAPKLIHDYLTPMPSHLLTTTLSDLVRAPVPPPSSPTICSPARVLPQGHHLVYFPIQTPPSLLGPDGADPDHSPGAAYPRRMWAGGEVIFHPGWDKNLVLDGRPWRCREDIGGVDVRGPPGEEKVFVHVWRRYGLGHAPDDHPGAEPWDLEERRTLVFMRKASSSAGEPPRRVIRAPHAPAYSCTAAPSPRHLFYFSALTLNAHAIHLDPLCARLTDSHRALLVHGPLTLALMLQALRGPVARISYRNHAPLYVDEPLRVCVREASRPGHPREVWVEGPEGGIAVRGSALMAG